MATNHWVDITSFLDDACRDLAVGQLICREELSLQEAMSAVEILDPKMDSGTNYRDTFTMEERMEMGSLYSSDNLNIDQCLAIMDHLLCCKMTWLSGYSLAQTVFTCLYLHNSYSIQNPWLSIYAKILMKDCEVLRTSVMRADVYEEEDFNTQTFGLDMKNGLPDSEILNELKQSEDNLIDRVRVCKQKSKKSKDAESADVIEMPLCSDELKELDYCEALLARIRLARALYAVSIGFEKLSASSQCRGGETLKKSIVFALAQIEMLKKSREWLGDIQKNIPIGVFDPVTAKILSHPSPTARIADILSWEKSLERLVKLLQHSQSICEFPMDYVGNNTTQPPFQYLQAFFERFSNWNCDIIARSRLTLVFCSNKKVFGLYEMSDILKTFMEDSYHVPSSIFLEIAAEFVTFFSNTVVQWFKMLCFNPARQRRKIHKQAGDWAELQRIAAEVDSKITPNEQNHQYLSCMVLDFVLANMIYYLRLGFQLELYASHEFPMIYWYIDYLRGMENQNLTYKVQMEPPKSSKTQKKKSKPKKLQPQTPTVNTVEHLIMSAHSSMTRAIFRLIFAVNSKLKINTHDAQFPLGNPELRFYHRFSLFHNFLQPAPLLYDHFVETTDVKMLSPEQLFEGAVESFKEARGFVERTLHNHAPKLSPEQHQQLQQLAKAAITNTVHIQLYSKAKQLKSHPTFDFAVNPEYPVILWHS